MRFRLVQHAAMGLVLLLGALVGSPAPADAWAWDPHVTLNGKIGCTYSSSNHVQWAWIEATNGERGWAWLGSGGMTRPYAFDFWKVPTSTIYVTVTWGCSVDGQHKTTFGLNRPSNGTTATRNVCYWSPCWL